MTTTHDDDSPWLTVREAAARAKVGRNLIYDAVRAGRLRAVRIGARDIRVHVTWLDAWLAAATLINPDAPGDDVPIPLAFSGRARR